MEEFKIKMDYSKKNKQKEWKRQKRNRSSQNQSASQLNDRTNIVTNQEVPGE